MNSLIVRTGAVETNTYHTGNAFILAGEKEVYVNRGGQTVKIFKSICPSVFLNLFYHNVGSVLNALAVSCAKKITVVDTASALPRIVCWFHA